MELLLKIVLKLTLIMIWIVLTHNINFWSGMGGSIIGSGTGTFGGVGPLSKGGTRTSRLISPSDDRVQHVFSQLSSNFALRAQDEKTLSQGVVQQRERIGFDLIERESRELEKCSTMASSIEVENHMKKLGYTPVSATIIDETGTSHTYTLYSKDCTQLIYAVEAEIVKNQIVPLMRSPTRFTSDRWLFNYQEKLCVSIPREGKKFYHSDIRVGLIIRCNSKAFLETFPLDKLTPTGFRKSTRSPTDAVGLVEEAADIAAVKRYAHFFEGYQKIISYSDAFSRNILLMAINSDNPNAREDAYRLIASYDKLSLELEKNPLVGKFLRASMLTLKIEALKKFIEEYKDIIDTPENYTELFEKSNTTSILSEADALLRLSQDFDSSNAEYRNIILHKKSSEWGPKWGHPDLTSGTTAYLSGRFMGTSSLKRPIDNPVFGYNEINIRIPKDASTGRQIPGSIELAAMKLDADNFARDAAGHLTLNAQRLQTELTAEVPPFYQASIT